MNIIDDSSLSATTVAFYGSIPSPDYWNLVSQYSNQLNVFGSESNNLDTNDLSSDANDPWYYATFSNDADVKDNAYTGYSFYYNVSSLTNNNDGTFTGQITGEVFQFHRYSLFSEYNNMVIATLRSRGISLYSNNADLNEHGPIYEISGLN